MKCPLCNIDLVMSDRQGIEIDYCPECRGVWLDRGELDKIIDRSVPAAPALRETSDRDHYESREKKDYRPEYYHKKKKESWLGEIFDF